MTGQSTLRRVRLPPTLAAAVLLLGTVAGCGDSGDGASGCRRPTREALDPGYLRHVLGDEDLEYTSDPPTSGPHQPGPGVGGIVSEPLTRPVQVGILEGGDVLLQHDGSLGDGERDELEALAGDRVVVAPNPDLGDAVVATAWLFKQTCASVDVDALEEFIADRVGNGPEG